MSTDEEKKLAFELRKLTGSGVMDCLFALRECDYDINKAIIYLQKRPKHILWKNN